MSRTLRRRGATYHYYWVLCDFRRHEDGSFRAVTIEPRSARGTRLLNRFHADAGGRSLMLGAPKAFRKSFTRAMRSQHRTALERWLRRPVDEREPLLQSNHLHSATYVYW